VSDVIITEGLRSNIGYAPNVRILLKCISKAADNLRISKFRAYTGRECILLLQFPVQDFGLDHFTFQSFNFWSSSLLHVSGFSHLDKFFVIQWTQGPEDTHKALRSTVKPVESSYATTAPYTSTRNTSMIWSLTPSQNTRRR